MVAELGHFGPFGEVWEGSFGGLPVGNVSRFFDDLLSLPFSGVGDVVRPHLLLAW